MNSFPYIPTHSDASPGVPAVTAFSQPVKERLNRLYEIAESSHYLFGSPLGPLHRHGKSHYLPRFVYFGPNTSDDAVRLSFSAGHDLDDPRATEAVVRFLERLAIAPDLGHGLHLSFFPVMSLSEATPSPEVGCFASDWQTDDSVEVTLLRGDALLRSYHGFVRVVTGFGDEGVTATLRGLSFPPDFLKAESRPATDPAFPFSVRWVVETAAVKTGPVTLAPDLPFTPFELVLSIPAVWSTDDYVEAFSLIARDFILRYRAAFSYGMNL